MTAAGSLRYERLYDPGADRAVRVFGCGMVLCTSGVLYDLGSKRPVGTADSLSCEVVAVDGGWLAR